MYELLHYDMMFSDRLRRDAMLRSLDAIVQPGDVVVELGTGVGYFAVAAAQRGARHVYAIETNDAVVLGPELAARNGVADRITFLHGHSLRQTLPERGDVLVWDLRGTLPMVNDHIASVADARERLLTPDARLQNVRDLLFAAPCEFPPALRELVFDGDGDTHGIDRSPIFARTRTRWSSSNIRSDLLLAPPAEWARIEWATVTSPDVRGSVSWMAARDGKLYGLSIWFDGELAGGAWLRNAPGEPGLVYARTFLPFERPLEVRAGDRIEGEIAFLYVSGEYVSTWEATVTPGTSGERPVQRARHSSFNALAISASRLERLSLDHRPPRTAHVAALGEILQFVDGVRSVREIGALLRARFPERFADEHATHRLIVRALDGLADDADIEPW